MTAPNDSIDAEAAAAFVEWSNRLTKMPSGQSIRLAEIIEDATRAETYRQALIALHVPPADALAMTVAYIQAMGVGKIKVEMPPEPEDFPGQRA